MPTTVGGVFRLVLAGDRRWLLLTLGACGFMLHQVAEALVPVLIGVVVDRAIVPRDGSALGLWLGVLAAVFVVLTMAWRIGMRSTVRAFSFAAHDLRQLTVARVLDPLGMARQRAAGETLTIASSDTNRVAGISWLVTGQLGALAAIGTTAVSLLLVSVPLGIAVLVATPVMLLVMHRLSVPLEAPQRDRAGDRGARRRARDRPRHGPARPQGPGCRGGRGRPLPAREPRLPRGRAARGALPAPRTRP